MPQFTNTRVIDTVTSITSAQIKKFDNPFNILSDQKPLVTDYYNQNVENTSLDESLHSEYASTGDQSPIRFNKIIDAVLFGGVQFQVDLDVTDYGLASNEIAGELTVMPNTFRPYPGDFMRIKHIGNQYLFKVINVNVDTLPNGANYYRIGFEYDKLDYASDLDKQVVNRFKMIVNNVGTEYQAIIREEIYDIIDRIENVNYSLKKFYHDIFFKDKIQNFVFEYRGYQFYDPYMIEFLKRNGIYDDEDYFISIYHELPQVSTFSLDYAKCFLRRVEQCDIKKDFYLSAIGKMITNKASIFSTRADPYFEIKYNDASFALNVPTIDMELLEHCKDNLLYENSYKNIIVKYFNHIDPTIEDIELLQDIDMGDNIEIFYNIPIIIYILNLYKTNQIRR